MTLGTQGALQGLVLVYTNGGGSATAPQALQSMDHHQLLGLPKQAWIWLVIAIGATVLLSAAARPAPLRDRHQPAAAFLAGNNVRRTLVVPYCLGAVGAGAGILLMAFNGGALLQLGDPYLFATAAAVAVGGASILGGAGPTSVRWRRAVADADRLAADAVNLGAGWLPIAYGA